jgi:hypothetical protein
MQRILSLVKFGAVLFSFFLTGTLLAEEPASNALFLEAPTISQDDALDLQTVIYKAKTDSTFRNQVIKNSQNATWSNYVALHAEKMDEYDLTRGL